MVSNSNVPEDQVIEGQDYQTKWFHLERMRRTTSVESEVDRNPFIEIFDEIVDYGLECRLMAQRAIDQITGMVCHDKTCFQATLNSAKNVVEKVRRVEDFDYVTDNPHPNRGGDKLWGDIASSVTQLKAEVEKVVLVWESGDYPEDFVQYFEGLGVHIESDMRTRIRSFNESQVWIFLNFFSPYKPFFFRQASGQYVVQSYKRCIQNIDMRSVSLYFMVRTHDDESLIKLLT